MKRLFFVVVLLTASRFDDTSLTAAAANNSWRLVPSWMGGRRRYKQSRVLQEQRVVLERQMRQGQDELIQLRKQFQLA